MREVTHVFKIGGPPEYLSECWHDVQAVELDKRHHLRENKTETIDDRNTSEDVETKLRKLFLILRAQGVWN